MSRMLYRKDTNKATPLKTDEELLSEYREDKYQKFTEHEACWSLNSRGPMGETALHICFLLNTPVHIQIAHIMIEMYPKLVLDVYEGTEYFGESSLHIAVVNGNLRSVQYLISKNINVNQRATGTFFLPADQVGRRKKETDFKGLAHYGEYPLAFAACHEHYEIYDYLMNYGANPNFQDSFGNTVLHMIVITNKVEFYKYAVKHMTIPGDTKMTNIYDLTPLALACKLGRPEIFHVMLELSAIELWRYSNITCSVYPIANLDTVDPDGVTSWTTALNLILDGETDEHLDMMEGKVIKQLLDEKWKTFAQRGFFKLLVFAFLHLILLSIAVYTRPISDFLQYRGAIDAVRFLCEIIVCILCILVLSLSAKDLYQLGIKGFLKNSSHAPSKTIFVICCVLTLLCIPLRFAKLEGAEDFLMIIAVPGSWCVLLFFARGMVLTGPFVTMIYKMIIGDVFRFVIIYLIMVGAFAQAFFFLFRDIDDSSITTFRDLVATIINLFQMTLGEFSYDHMNQAHYSTLTKLLFIVFMILIPILLLNMLIAMMGNTYQSVMNKAEIEWKKQYYGKEMIKQVKEHMKKNTKVPMVIREMKKKMYIKDMDGKFVLASEEKNVNLMSTLQSAAWSEDIDMDKSKTAKALEPISENGDGSTKKENIQKKPDESSLENRVKPKTEPETVSQPANKSQQKNKFISLRENPVKRMQPKVAPLWNTRASEQYVPHGSDYMGSQYNITNLRGFQPLDLDKSPVDYSDTTNSSSPSLRSSSASSLRSASAQSKKSRLSYKKLPR
ncbi:transient receptor potential cation channel subfamily V member 5-like [Octopus vulgaris]|uniref:Transient receptor potential cation channel subfamily V member 5-like n=1 Tax=Octopus vulgaris TaxID=6645 RepID=A0AA36ANV4_OCTVU|nr:transient receptor potential cation channel subfamily V member 5-like [Octopus vulgaris]